MTPRLIAAIVLGIGTGALGLALSFLPFMQEIDADAGLGLLFQLRGTRTPPQDVIVVSIDKESSEELKISEQPDRWPRWLHARLVEKLAHAGVKGIVFDVQFIEPKAARDDNLLVTAVAGARNVVLAEPLVTKDVQSSGGANKGGNLRAEHTIVRILKPFAPLAQAAAATAPFVLPRLPFKVNQFWTFHSGAGDAPTMPVMAFQLYCMPVYEEFMGLLREANPAQAARLPSRAGSVVENGGLGRVVRQIREVFESDPSTSQKMLDQLDRMGPRPLDEGKRRLIRSAIKMYGGSNSRYINYYGPPRTVTTIPFYQALRVGESTDSQKASDFFGKVIFIGQSENLQADTKDSFYTVFAQENGVFLAGVEIAATAFLNLLEDAPVEPVPAQERWLILLLVGVFGGLICFITSATMAAIAAVCLTGAYLFAAAYFFKANGTWYPIAIPLFLQVPVGFLGGVFWNYLNAKKEQRQMKKAFAHYIPDSVVNQFARNRGHVKSGGETVYGACLFADIAGYTTLAETMTPKELSELMNRYFEVAFEPVKKHGGLVVDLVGDSFLAIWTAKQEDAALRRQACLAAVDITTAVHRFNASFEDFKLPTRIGVHCGEIFLGNVGAGDHYEYHPAGDTVNTASRMDGLNKYLGTEVLASGELLDRVGALLTRNLGTYKLKGKEQPIVVHELVARLEQADKQQRQRCAFFAQALSAFNAQNWDAAIAKFQELIEFAGSDGPARFYLRLCEQYKSSPPQQPWDRTIVLEEK